MTPLKPDFKMWAPAGPGPLISPDSDDDSFVILGKSLSEVDYKSTEPESPIGNNNIEEAKKVIEEEMKNLTDSGPSNLSNLLISIGNPKEINISKESQDSVLKETYSSLGSDKNLHSVAMSDDLQKNIADMVAENRQLRLTLEQNNVMMLEQYQKCIEWKNEVQNVHDTYKNKLFESTQLIEKLLKEKNEMQNIMTDLQEELHNAKTQLTELQVAQNDVMQSKAATSLKKNELITENQKLKETVEQLEREAKDKDEVNAMQTQLLKEKTATQNKYANIEEELHNATTQLAELQVVQTDIMQSRAAAYIRVNDLISENQKLKESVEKLEREAKDSDEKYALLMQLEVFKRDFEAERQAKEGNQEIIDRLTEDLQNLQRRNQQLLDEKDIMCNRGFVMYESSSDRNTEQRRNQGVSLPCPKCHRSFASITELQVHCDTCLT